MSTVDIFAPATQRILLVVGAVLAIAALVGMTADMQLRQQPQQAALVAPTPEAATPEIGGRVAGGSGGTPQVEPRQPLKTNSAPVERVAPANTGAANLAATAERTTPVVQTTFDVVDVVKDLQIRAEPFASSRIVGTLPAHSAKLGTPMRAWVMKKSPDGNWGRVTIPWQHPISYGWISLQGLQASATDVIVRADLSDRMLRIEQGGKIIREAPMTVGAAESPSPPGYYYITDPTPVPANQPYFGGYAFGISGIQPNLPAGWSSQNNQMAIHGTNDPGSIGQAASAGCLRVSEETLRILRKVLERGTPVIISK
jgi:lipoprotein-anchoring transpeptidase ErfK/SrfK